MSARFYRVKLKDKPAMLVEAHSPALAWFRVTEPDVKKTKKDEMVAMMKDGCDVITLDEGDGDEI